MKQINTNLTKVLSTCLLLSFAVQCCAATTVSIEDITADPGDVVTVPLMINNMTDFGTGTINITYDPAVVHVTAVTGSSAFNNNNVIGFTAISSSNAGGASGDIVFANVEFTAVGAGSSPLNINVISLYDRSSNQISATIDNGSFTSGDVSTPPTPTPAKHTGSSSGGRTTGSVSISAPIPSPTQTASAEGGADLTSNPGSTSHNEGDTNVEAAAEETDTPGTTQSTVKPAPNSQTSVSGFEAIFAVTGFVILSLIIRRGNT